jgi:hypothetical protein
MLGGKKDNQQQETVARQQPQHTQQGFQAPLDAGVKPNLHNPSSEEWESTIPF